MGLGVEDTGDKEGLEGNGLGWGGVRDMLGMLHGGVPNGEVQHRNIVSTLTLLIANLYNFCLLYFSFLPLENNRMNPTWRNIQKS